MLVLLPPFTPATKLNLKTTKLVCQNQVTLQGFEKFRVEFFFQSKP
jgi:hypothetical protein